MKLEKHFERLCKKAVFADDVLLKLIDYVMINENNHPIRSYNLLEDILRQYHKNDNGFRKSKFIFLKDDRELYRNLKALCATYVNSNFEDVRYHSYLFDNYLKYSSSILKDGRINIKQVGVEKTFFVGLPIYDLNNNKLGVLSHVYDDENRGYCWKILGYKGKRQKIKTYWQVLKAQLESFKITK